MAAVLRCIVVLFAFFSVLNSEALEDKSSFDESKLSNLDNSANSEDLANDPAREYNENESVALQDETEGKRNTL